MDPIHIQHCFTVYRLTQIMCGFVELCSQFLCLRTLYFQKPHILLIFFPKPEFSMASDLLYRQFSASVRILRHTIFKSRFRTSAITHGYIYRWREAALKQSKICIGNLKNQLRKAKFMYRKRGGSRPTKISTIFPNMSNIVKLSKLCGTQHFLCQKICRAKVWNSQNAVAQKAFNHCSQDLVTLQTRLCYSRSLQTVIRTCRVTEMCNSARTKNRFWYCKWYMLRHSNGILRFQQWSDSVRYY